MATDPNDFAGQPAGGKRTIGAIAWLAILAGCAAAGVILNHFQPVERLVSAIERNGVATAPPSRSVAETAAPREQAPNESAVTPPKVVLLNPGTLEEEQPVRTVGIAGSQTGEERGPVPVMTAPTKASRKPPPSASPTGNIRDRKVLVVVRRVVPPYDTKILRGRMTDGRLVLDSRDRRGMTIR